MSNSGGKGSGARAMHIHISGPIFTSLLHETPSEDCDEHVYGLLFGNHRTKRNISMSDSSENDVTLDHNITISHYTSYSTEQFDASKCSDYLRAITHNRNDVCLGMFVIKRGNQQLYPSFREMSILNEIGLNSHSSSGLKSSFPLLLLMLSVPRREYDGSNSEAGWIYNIKHDCFAYTCRPTPQFSNVRLSIPSLAPDLQSEFSGEACLNTGRITSDSRCFSEEGNEEIWHERHNSGGLLSRQMANMAAAGLTQVVDTELLASGLIDSIKGELKAVMELEAELEILRNNSQREMKTTS